MVVMDRNDPTACFKCHIRVPSASIQCTGKKRRFVATYFTCAASYNTDSFDQHFYDIVALCNMIFLKWEIDITSLSLLLRALQVSGQPVAQDGRKGQRGLNSGHIDRIYETRHV
ncbi:hypothetical protein TNCV_3596991 [Trichonephila clavipes]|nr:hypothetical protein TNCV_3596991 [Trichonephila clavipes]